MEKADMYCYSFGGLALFFFLYLIYSLLAKKTYIRGQWYYYVDDRAEYWGFISIYVFAVLLFLFIGCDYIPKIILNTNSS